MTGRQFGYFVVGVLTLVYLGYDIFFRPIPFRYEHIALVKTLTYRAVPEFSTKFDSQQCESAHQQASCLADIEPLNEQRRRIYENVASAEDMILNRGDPDEIALRFVRANQALQEFERLQSDWYRRHFEPGT